MSFRFIVNYYFILKQMLMCFRFNLLLKISKIETQCQVFWQKKCIFFYFFYKMLFFRLLYKMQKNDIIYQTII